MQTPLMFLLTSLNIPERKKDIPSQVMYPRELGDHPPLLGGLLSLVQQLKCFRKSFIDTQSFS
jgi:hypothetical protein